MKLMSFESGGNTGWGIVRAEEVVDLSGLWPDMKAFLASGALLPSDLSGLPRLKLNQISFLPPITQPNKIFCIGLNYLSHAKEGGREVAAYPTVFTRFANSQVGHLQHIVRPHVSERLDFEGELAIVISKTCRHVKREDAFSVIAGYSCYNDGTVRDWQRHSTQFTPGKNFNKSGAFGPWMVTPDEFGDPTKAELTTRLNGEVMQHAPVSDLVFDIPALVEYCSTFIELDAGDVIVTGTTDGVGAYRKPPLWMKPGDVIEVEVSGVGILRNTVFQEGN